MRTTCLLLSQHSRVQTVAGKLLRRHAQFQAVADIIVYSGPFSTSNLEVATRSNTCRIQLVLMLTQAKYNLQSQLCMFCQFQISLSAKACLYHFVFVRNCQSRATLSIFCLYPSRICLCSTSCYVKNIVISRWHRISDFPESFVKAI